MRCHRSWLTLWTLSLGIRIKMKHSTHPTVIMVCAFEYETDSKMNRNWTDLEILSMYNSYFLQRISIFISNQCVDVFLSPENESAFPVLKVSEFQVQKLLSLTPNPFIICKEIFQINSKRKLKWMILVYWIISSWIISPRKNEFSRRQIFGENVFEKYQGILFFV